MGNPLPLLPNHSSNGSLTLTTLRRFVSDVTCHDLSSFANTCFFLLLLVSQIKAAPLLSMLRLSQRRDGSDSVRG